jgi:hypothetical protein
MLVAYGQTDACFLLYIAGCLIAELKLQGSGLSLIVIPSHEIKVFMI